jgi:hypothetical protein
MPTQLLPSPETWAGLCEKTLSHCVRWLSIGLANTLRTSFLLLLRRLLCTVQYPASSIVFKELDTVLTVLPVQKEVATFGTPHNR